MVLRFVLLLPLLLIAPQAFAAHAHEGGETSMASHLSEDSGASFDVHYLKMMVNHHKDGIEMANAAQEHAERQEVKNFAAKMAAHQQHEIDEMNTLLKGMGKDAGEGHASFRDKAKADRAELVKQHGKAFDQAFIRHMAMHHEDAVAAAKLADGQAEAPAVKALAKKQAADQGREVEQLRTWHKDWFGSELPANKPSDPHAGHGDHKH